MAITIGEQYRLFLILSTIRSRDRITTFFAVDLTQGPTFHCVVEIHDTTKESSSFRQSQYDREEKVSKLKNSIKDMQLGGHKLLTYEE